MATGLMDRKHRHVQAWLDRLFVGSDVPQYEINERTIDILYDLMERNESRDKEAEALIEDLNQKAEEYNVEAVRHANILHSVGISVGNLSKSGSVSLATLASAANMLELKDASMSSYLLGLTRLSDEIALTSETREEEQSTIDELFSKTQNAWIKSSYLKKHLHSLEKQKEQKDAELKRKSQNAGFLHDKVQQYKDRLHHLQGELNKSGVDASIYHHTLVKRAEELKKLKDQVAPLRIKLDTYHKLPADPSLAEVKVEEAKRELDDLEKEIGSHINQMEL
ncbi:HAUS augmin-like complex subunit 1 [Saccoglossus kowalevskii]|uniref:HAUS augmin-like complex subunit 1-like n=1 Tax=Saccoglossus kowalevskii TaxID=10224 RepID=A0ABM0GLT3_SACKO|nr:PREDICTED: HAUS augmin-like complex subunit 1-like [Saccoglossus kowalevskii]